MFEITTWVVEQIAFKLATRRYEIEQSDGVVSGIVDQEDTLSDLQISWPNLAEQVCSYMEGYYPAYKKGREIGRIKTEDGETA